MCDKKVENALDLDVKLQCNSMTFHSKDFVAISNSSIGSKWMSDFYDVLITSGDNEIQAHRIILAKQSDFFKLRLKNEQLFKSGDCATIAIEGLKWNSVETVIEFMYTAHITVTSENVYDLVIASDFFYIPEIKKFCLEFLETYLCSDNCLTILDFAIYRNIEDLQEKAQKHLFKNFRYVVHCLEFKNLSLLKLGDLFRTVRDAPVKVCESIFFQGIINWMESNRGSEAHFEHLFDLVQLERLKLSYLVNTVAVEELVSMSLCCLQKLVKAIQSHVDESNPKNPSFSDSSVPFMSLDLQKQTFAECFTGKSVDSWFVISSEWMSKWVKYVTNDGYEWDSEMRVPDYPGPIDNASLFTNKSCKFLKRSLKPSSDYKFIPESAWDLLCSWYGVTEEQPPVGEKGPILNRHTPNQSDEEFVIDPVRLRLQYGGKTVTRVFSKWDSVDVVEKDSRKVFEFAEDVEIFLISGFSRLDKEKRIIDCELVDNQSAATRVPRVNRTCHILSHVVDVRMLIAESVLKDISFSIKGPKQKVFETKSEPKSTSDDLDKLSTDSKVKKKATAKEILTYCKPLQQQYSTPPAVQTAAPALFLNRKRASRLKSQQLA